MGEGVMVERATQISRAEEEPGNRLRKVRSAAEVRRIVSSRCKRLMRQAHRQGRVLRAKQKMQHPQGDTDCQLGGLRVRRRPLDQDLECVERLAAVRARSD